LETLDVRDFYLSKSLPNWQEKSIRIEGGEKEGVGRRKGRED
jgi:hypothetical protein